MTRDLLAALDLGSNTFRLILASEADGHLDFATRRIWQEIPRLSEGLSAGGCLKEEPKNRAWEALESFASVIEAQKPLKTLAGGTMVFRRASDGESFLIEIGQRFGWEVTVLTGTQEARLSALGVLSGLAPIPESGLIMDIGGRSTEFISTRGRKLLTFQSLDVGVVGLTEDFVKSDPPAPTELAAMAASVKNTLQAANCNQLDPKATLVGTAGTVTTLAAMLLDLVNYDSNLVNNQVIGRQFLLDLLATLSTESLETRRLHPGLHPRRADVIVAGLVLLVEVMNFLSKDSLVVSDNSLLEGLWLAAAGLAPLIS
jgi:exopolyphosphatase/guanosine-5'-triphosphate,3'-diphosphate pyrophosphatase